MSIISNLLLVTLVICLSVKYVSSIDCYVCDSSEAAPDHTNDGSSEEDTDDTNSGGCNKVKEEMIRTCANDDVCSILKLEKHNGVVEVARFCGIPDNDLKEMWEDGKTEGEFETPEGIASWSFCDEDLCNWGVMNNPQMITLFAGAILSVSVYYTFV